ncbi:hypothetical protein BT93_K0989 [Corymbia citriodora subsp. variegata]|nr:hypothetical protein BT93_K0989 [Corymbia citriodora subsp. variegata]
MKGEHEKERLWMVLDCAMLLASHNQDAKRRCLASSRVVRREMSQHDAIRPKSSSPRSTKRSKKKDGSNVRWEAKQNARRKSRKLAESLFYRVKSPSKNYGDNFSKEELQMIGLGYDRMVRFMEKDDPNLRHPHNWYTYGEFGPYSWRGVVVGKPIRGRFSEEHVTLLARAEIMRSGRRLSSLTWRQEQQWTLVAEVVLEAGKQRLDEWNLMGRLGNKARKLITQCAAWMRPDIIYVKRPVYQCRFEPQDDFIQLLMPFLDLRTKSDFLFEVRNGNGTVEFCTYFNGLCKILKANPKAFVDDVVKAHKKLSDEKRNECLEFLLTNHPTELLHPYTKEWKAKLEEMGLHCDAPPDDEDDSSGSKSDNEIVDWTEDDGNVNNSERTEKLLKQSVEVKTELYKKQLKEMKDGDETTMRGAKPKVSPEECKITCIGPGRKRIRKSKIAPELFLRAAVRPFTYRNLVKEVVLTRHAILDGVIGTEKPE